MVYSRRWGKNQQPANNLHSCAGRSYACVHECIEQMFDFIYCSNENWLSMSVIYKLSLVDFPKGETSDAAGKTFHEQRTDMQAFGCGRDLRDKMNYR